MKISAINTSYNPTTNARRLKVDKTKVLRSEEYKDFMKSIDEWTTTSLKRIEENYVPGSRSREDEIENLFMYRDNMIRNKKIEMMQDEGIPAWRRILIGLGILSY